jgi:signal peptidase I
MINIADKDKTPTEPNRPGSIRAVAEVVLWFAFFMVLRTSVFATYMIPSGSMENTLLIGDFIVCNRFIYGARLPMTDFRLPAVEDPQAGDVVVFLYPGDGQTRYIKRCVAVGGDTVEVRDKQLFVNGVASTDAAGAKYIDRNAAGERRIVAKRDNFGPYVVPTDHFFMMGDNRDNSNDSRFWHPEKSVSRDKIVGRASFIHWSWNDAIRPAPEVSLSDPLSVPRLFAFNIVHFFEKARFGRIGRSDL